MVVESAQMNDETNVCHIGHQNLSGLEQARAGKHVGLVTQVRTIMSLPFTCNQSSQRPVSTVVLIKHKHLPMVSGTWHFPDRSMCADSVCCTHRHTYTQPEVSGKHQAIRLLSAGPLWFADGLLRTEESSVECGHGRSRASRNH